MLLKLDAGHLSIPLGYILFFGAILHLTPCAGQLNPDFQLFRDSLHRHISHEMQTEFTLCLSYAQGSAFIVSNLDNNQNELDQLTHFLRQALSHPALYVSKIRITGYSSIESDYAKNEALSRERVEHFHRYLQKTYPELQHYPFDLAWVAEDWNGLSKLIRESDLNEREEILEVIRKVRVYDDREMLIKRLNGGSAYRKMEATMLPKLRRIELRIDYQTTPTANSLHSVLPEEEPVQPTLPELEDTYNDASDFQNNRSLALAVASRREPHVSSQTTHGSVSHGILPQQVAVRFALKTNVLLWAGVQHDFKHTAPVANVALEYYISNHVSLELGAMYSYWRYNSNQKFQGISGYRLESRYRISLPATRGRMEIFLGLYGRVGDYDIRKKNNTINYTGDYWDAGLSTGFTVNLVGQLGLELGTRAGYVKTRPIKYEMDNQYNWFEGRYKYYQFKVTDLNVSLVYRFR